MKDIIEHADFRKKIDRAALYRRIISIVFNGILGMFCKDRRTGSIPSLHTSYVQLISPSSPYSIIYMHGLSYRSKTESP